MFAFTAVASTISVSNFSFETLPVGGLPNNGCGTGCSYSTGVIPGWSGSDGTSGQFQPGTDVGNNAYFSTLSDGTTVAYSNNAILFQTVLPTVQVGVTYTLTVDLGRRNDQSFTAAAVSSPRHIAPSVRISRTGRTCLLGAKSYVADRTGAAFNPDHRRSW